MPEDGVKGTRARLVRCKAFPDDDQAMRLRGNIRLTASLADSLYQEGISGETLRPLQVRLRSRLGRALGEETYVSVSANPLNVVFQRVQRRILRGVQTMPKARGLAFYGDLPRLSPRTERVHVPLVGDFRIEPVQVEGSVRYTYFYEHRGEWIAAFIIYPDCTKLGKGGFRWKSSKGRMPGGVMW